MNPTLVMLSVEDGLRQYEVGEALGVALFTWAIVFAVLFIIFVIIRLFGAIVGSKTKKPAEAPTAAPAVAAPAAVEEPGEEFSSGTLKLKGCDEKTAAMIMAIVSDNTGIPLSELVFKSISLVEEK
ncbi:MAG: OadG family protein [Clostridiales bacterium]|nr:OadG family protein [Clostridiales bacterium]